METFSKRLSSLRKERKTTQADLAAMLELSAQTISVYENGREPSYEILCKLADYFNVTLDYLLGRSDFRSLEDAISAGSEPEITIPFGENEADYRNAFTSCISAMNRYKKTGCEASYAPYILCETIIAWAWDMSIGSPNTKRAQQKWLAETVEGISKIIHANVFSEFDDIVFSLKNACNDAWSALQLADAGHAEEWYAEQEGNE